MAMSAHFSVSVSSVLSTKSRKFLINCSGAFALISDATSGSSAILANVTTQFLLTLTPNPFSVISAVMLLSSPSSLAKNRVSS